MGGNKFFDANQPRNAVLTSEQLQARIESNQRILNEYTELSKREDYQQMIGHFAVVLKAIPAFKVQRLKLTELAKQLASKSVDRETLLLQATAINDFLYKQHFLDKMAQRLEAGLALAETNGLGECFRNNFDASISAGMQTVKMLGIDSTDLKIEEIIKALQAISDSNSLSHLQDAGKHESEGNKQLYVTLAQQALGLYSQVNDMHQAYWKQQQFISNFDKAQQKFFRDFENCSLPFNRAATSNGLRM
jgi:hypothetical protein